MIKTSKAIDDIPKSDLEALHTGTLLTRLQRLRQCEESFESTDLNEDEIKKLRQDGRIHVKKSAEWKRAFTEVKDILDTREHIPTAAERKEKRMSRSKKQVTKN